MLVAGAIIGSFFDGFHTHWGTTSYPQPVLWMMAWWTPLLFSGVYTLLGMLYSFGQRLAPARKRAGGELYALAMFGFLYFLSAALPVSNVIKLVVLLAAGLLLWAALDRTWPTFVLGLFAAFIGPFTEVVFVHWGIFSHLQPDFFGIPMWLPALYFASAAGAGPAFARMGMYPMTVSWPSSDDEDDDLSIKENIFDSFFDR
jgi:hypothetical protein